MENKEFNAIDELGISIDKPKYKCEKHGTPTMHMTLICGDIEEVFCFLCFRDMVARECCKVERVD